MARLRSATSITMISIMPSRMAQPANARPASQRPYALDTRSITTRPARSMRLLFGEERLEARGDVRALLHRGGPCDFVGLVAECLGGRRIEADRLDAGFRLPLCFFGGIPGPENVLGLHREHLPGEVTALRIRQSLVGGQVHHDGNLGIVETGIDAELGLLVPVEIEDATDGPAVTINNTTFERGVDLARRRGDDGRAKRLEKIAIDRGDADLQSGEVGLVDLLVDIDVERLVLHHAADVLHVGFFVPDLVD